MKEIEILGENRFDTFTKTREGSRAIIVQDGMILLSHETISGWYLVPGGGLENDETPVDCCVREVEEETGVIVRPLHHFLTLYEYYEEYRYISYYFVCERIGLGQMHLTEPETPVVSSHNGSPSRKQLIFSRVINPMPRKAKKNEDRI